MKKHIMMQFESSINVSKETLWQSINTFPRLNCELWPVLKMTYPKKYRALPFEGFPMNE